nr:RNA-directed DNA polymerase, eukaryota, reverse transcriptase zinc-binding domain protein [Tanacetum cinerariifolium]
MNLLLADMQNLDQKTDEGLASHVSKLQELDYFEKMNSLDLMQKARVNWEVEGDKNSMFFHGLINSRRKSQSIHGIMHEGIWLSDPKDIKEAFLNFYKKKFSCHDSQVSFPSFMPARHLNTSDHDLLEAVVSRGINQDDGVNSAFITLIPKVSNPLFIKDYRPISLIDLHYKVVAKILSNRLSKVIDSTISPEQSAFISGRQILDGPLIFSEIIDWYKKRKKKLMLFKVDFEKAFDYAPEMVIKSLEILHANFFWGSHESSKKLSWVKWSNTLASFDKDGLGVGSLSAFNKALLLKWRWRLFNFPNSLWVQVIKAFHGNEADIDLISCMVCNSMLNRRTAYFSLLKRLLQFGILFNHRLICFFQAFSRVKIGPTGLIHGMFLRTKRAPRNSVVFIGKEEHRPLRAVPAVSDISRGRSTIWELPL